MRRNATAVLELQKEGLPVIAVEPQTGQPVEGALLAFFDRLPRRMAERLVSMYLEYPGLALKNVGIVVKLQDKGGRPRRPTAQELGMEVAQQREKRRTGVPRIITVGVTAAVDSAAEEQPWDGEESDSFMLSGLPNDVLTEEQPGDGEEPDSPSPGTQLKRRTATVRANVRSFLVRQAQSEGAQVDEGLLWDLDPPCTCDAFWTHYIRRMHPPSPFWKGVIEPYQSGTHPPCDGCGRQGEGYYERDGGRYCDLCTARLWPVPPHRHCATCGATSEEAPAGLHTEIRPFAWVHPITLELDQKGWYCAYCIEKGDYRRTMLPKWREDEAAEDQGK